MKSPRDTKILGPQKLGPLFQRHGTKKYEKVGNTHAPKHKQMHISTNRATNHFTKHTKTDMDLIDVLMGLIASNDANKYVVIEALAGCGKTSMLTGLVKRINDKKSVLLLSFTNGAVSIARVRTDDGLHVQTFDSLFYQSVKHGMANGGLDLDNDTTGYTYETFRDVAEILSEDTLKTFVGKAASQYKMDEIDFVLVDEAQDSPPQAYTMLQMFRAMGKCVIITGDRYQSIFGFMNTDSLFDTIPAADKIVHYLRETRRCCNDVVAFVNERFDLDMTTAYTSTLGPDVVESVCIQALYNATLGRLYAKFLFTMSAVLTVEISEGDSTSKFWDAVHAETRRIYSVSAERAVEIVKEREQALAKKHRFRDQQPRHLRLPTFVFSTVHHFKGGECDISVIAEDVAVCEKTAAEEDERMKYVAATRARWGIVDMRGFKYIGHEGARGMFHKAFLKCRENFGRGTAPRITSVSTEAATIIPLITSPILTPFVDKFRRLFVTLDGPLPPTLPSSAAMRVASIVNILVGWRIERVAREHGVGLTVNNSELRTRDTRDMKYSHLKKNGVLPLGMEENVKRLLARKKIQATFGRFLVVRCGWSVTRPLVLRAALAKSQLCIFMMSYSLLRLKPERLGLVATIRIIQIMDKIMEEEMSGILGQPEKWAIVNIHQEAPSNNLFFFRGNADIILEDKQRNCHLVEIKTVRAISPSHILQMIFYRLVLDVNMRTSMKGLNCIYEANRNVLVSFDPQAIMELSRNFDNGILAELDRVLYTKTIPSYYPQSYGVDTLQKILS